MNTHILRTFHRVLLIKASIVCCLICFRDRSNAQVATINISNINTTVMNKTGLLFGITFDSRTSMTGNMGLGQFGYYNANGTVIPEVNALFNDFPFSTLRYPGNGIAVGFDWKKSIGPVATRPNQDLLGTQGTPQPVNFGFDEFMAMLEAKGVSGSEVQIMVPIYDIATPGLSVTQQRAAIANVISNNADWVEYCNAPNDNSNPGGGIDWASQRAANGHHLPYGIKIWNIGNEPWSDFEFGSTADSCNSFISKVTPIINAMLAIDPSIKITMPTTGNATNQANWSNALLNSSLVAQGKVYALSQHYFPTERSVNGNIPMQGVSSVNSALNSLITVASSKSVKVFVGDYAHYIPLNPTTAQKDSAMQWLGANLEADFLLMLSQKSTIERANFWTYGNAQAVWRPIRYNSAGNYTLLPAASIYKILNPAFLDRSVAVSTTSPGASDGINYAIRSNAFTSADLSRLNIVAVNRDKNNTVPLQISGTGSYFLSRARILTASALNSETIIENTISPDINGHYPMPPMSVLIVEYNLSVIPITFTDPLSAYRVTDGIEVIWATSGVMNCEKFEVEKSADGIAFEKLIDVDCEMQTVSGHLYKAKDLRPFYGQNYYRIKAIDTDGKYKYSKILPVYYNDAITEIYPNPVRTMLKINTVEVVEKVEIFDVIGKKIKTIKNSNRIIDMSNFLPGIYNMKIYTGTNNIIIKKILKN